ncbi:MAG: C40 family peptidase [Lachnospiraceae bacterium]|nr:C40 family peptidase [Lachnospiraceae bacterium]
MKKTVVKFSAGVLAGLLLMNPLEAAATEGGMTKDAIPSGGIASIYTMSMTEAECMEVAKEAQGALWGYTNLGIADVSEYLNVRKGPSTSDRVIGKMPSFSACEILEEKDGWAHIKSGEVEGYVSCEYLLTGAAAIVKANELIQSVAVVKADALMVRKEPSLEAPILTKVPLNEELQYLETVGEWVKVSIDGMDAYVFGEYVEIKEDLDTAITMAELRYGEGVTDIRVDIVEYAKQFLGNPYKWGGTSLTKGADCSGFVQSVFKHFGIKISRTSRSQSKDGKKISVSELQPGDLLFYEDETGTINHVTMYIGNGQVIHASSPKSGIKISKYNYRTPVKCVDIIQD